MNKLLSILLTGFFATTLSMGAMATDVAKPAGDMVAAATSTTTDAKTPAKMTHKSHKKHEGQKSPAKSQ